MELRTIEVVAMQRGTKRHTIIGRRDSLTTQLRRKRVYEVEVRRSLNTLKERWGESKGEAKTTDEAGRLRVSFFPLIYSDYNILSVADDYQWALVGSSTPDYLWILSRSKELHPDTLEHIITLAQSRGYDTSKLLFL